MPERICIIGLPRSGSSYLAALIESSSDGKTTDLLEPFTEAFPSSISLKEDQLILNQLIPFQSVENSLETLTKGDVNQSVVFRIFPYDYIADEFTDLIDAIKKLNFKFLVIKRRNITHHMISYGVALATDVWDTNNPNYKKIENSDDKVVITNFSNLQWLIEKIYGLDDFLESLDINYDVIYYEDIAEELPKYLGHPINDSKITLKKQSTDDPYNQIKNYQLTKLIIDWLMKQKPKLKSYQYKETQ